jgi:branched-chain amino acid transport system permease protein
MDGIFGIPAPLPFGQLLLGLINGAFYAMLSLGLAVIFGLLNIVNMAHGALFMDGRLRGLDAADLARPRLLVGAAAVAAHRGRTGVLLERAMISKLYKLDHLYGLLLTFGMGLIIEGLVRNDSAHPACPTASRPSWPAPGTSASCSCLSTADGWSSWRSSPASPTWLVIEKTKIGSYLRAATENPALVQAFGINVPRMMTLTYGAGVALAAFAGVLAAPIYSVNPQMGSNLIIIVFAVVVIGGHGLHPRRGADRLRPRHRRGD